MMRIPQTIRAKPSSLGDAQRAHKSHGEESEEEQDSDEHMETASETRRRYYESTQDQVSDPDLWAILHYGEFTDEEEI